MSWKDDFSKRFIEVEVKPEKGESFKVLEEVEVLDLHYFIEALRKETEQRVSHYANFLEKELEGDGYIIEAIRERYERHFKGVE
jgi:hypothetical protein